MSAQSLHPLMRMCGADNRMGKSLCYDRLDLPESPALTQRYLPNVLVPSCDSVEYIGMNPTQFRGGQAAVCVNQTSSSLLQHLDEARDGYIDPRAYKRTARIVAPLSETSQGRRTSVISGITNNTGALHDVETNAAHIAGARGGGPIAVQRGIVHGKAR